MNNNATISLMDSDGSVYSIYNHRDGDIDHLGATLYQYYQEDITKVYELINLGDVYHVGAFIAASPFTKRFNPKSETISDIQDWLGADSNDKKTTAGQLAAAIRDTEDYFTAAYRRDGGQGNRCFFNHYDDKDSIPFRKYNYLFVPDNQGSGTWYFRSAKTQGTFLELSRCLFDYQNFR